MTPDSPFPSSGGLAVRTLDEGDVPGWIRALHTGFVRPPTTTPEEVAVRLPYYDLSRMRGAFDEGRCVATFRSFAQEVTAVGGAPVAATAVTNVSVSPTHRRRGLLSRLMAAEFADARERGDVLATLIAAEYPIYGRYGYGPATSLTRWKVDLRRAGLDPNWSGPQDGGRVDLVDGDVLREVGPAVYDRARALRHGMVSRGARDWERRTGRNPVPGELWTEPFHATYRSAAGAVEGYVTYAADTAWDEGKQPLLTLTVRDLVAATPAAERALWRYVCAIDWVTFVRSGDRAPDDLLPSLLPDPRAARVETQADMMWVRVLDVVRALEARTYGTSGALVLDVRDAAGLAGGRYRLDASPEGATCAPTPHAADLVLDVGDLGALYLGDGSVTRLVALGRAEEAVPGAAARADLLLRTPRRAWCPDIF
ncbi:GNAT family N-acetyltransferase [Streptomyces fradiae]|uniref:GNAT family N-acetyltransferase n=1 Tax=Streptomyces fradiae TaxID=1906 RepID=UPI00294268CF|nr:GNAT family N-acetyltransferase [Streptomyces fradiae]WOI58703.1 GNAT family N-acetyltransferase [Streptomyces fradiae]